jgi:hypothetical protein
MREKIIREARSRAMTEKDRADFARYEGMFVSRKTNGPEKRPREQLQGTGEGQTQKQQPKEALA